MVFLTIPVWLQWFGFYKEGQDKEVYTLFESKIWTEVCTVEPLYNGQVGAGAFVHYLEVSFIGRCGCGLSLKIDDAI